MRGLASRAEVEAYRPAIAETAERLRWEKRPLHERDTYGRAFLQMQNLWAHDERVREFVFSKRFAGVAAELMGVAGVRLYHDQALFKEEGGGFTPWHQDQFYWPLATPHTITLWMPLVDVTETIGSMHSAPANRTDVLREVLTVIYFADGARVASEVRPGQRFDLKAWLRGCQPGAAAAGRLNPLLL